MRRFWIRFRAPVNGDRSRSLDPTVQRGVGVTAHSLEAALRLVQERIFAMAELLMVEQVIEDVDIRTLDPNHILPNMEPPNWAGIWFPGGYSELDP